jgi:hypothetical protein
MKVKGQTNWRANSKRAEAASASFLESSLRTEMPNYSHVLMVSTSVNPTLMTEYTAEMEKSCQTIGEMARHPLTRRLQEYVGREANLLLLRVAEHLGWSIPTQVDSRSYYNNLSPAFAPPLMAKPDHTQLNNGISISASGAVQLFNGAVNLSQHKSVSVNLGYDVGIAMFQVSSPCSVALPVSVRRARIDAKPNDNPIGNLKTIIGHDLQSATRLRAGYFQKVDDAFLSECQRLCGQADLTKANAGAAPLIFVPIVSVAGPVWSAAT